MGKLLNIAIMTFLVVGIFSIPTIAQTEDGLYYSDLMVKDGTFTWLVNQSLNYYEEIPEGANFTVKLKDSLYPGPLTEADLEKVYASIKVDDDKYTGEGFPLFFHTHKIENETTITIREDFDSEPELFNVTDVSGSIFRVNFSIFDDPYNLYIELDIDSSDGITKRYFEHFDDGADLEAVIELIYTGYSVEASVQFLWSIVGLVSITSLIVILRKRRRN
ncbi:MAG: hypothetical protein V3V41_03465 [Candidatus Heimdallarchaeota archaeon]